MLGLVSVAAHRETPRVSWSGGPCLWTEASNTWKGGPRKVSVIPCSEGQRMCPGSGYGVKGVEKRKRRTPPEVGTIAQALKERVSAEGRDRGEQACFLNYS